MEEPRKQCVFYFYYNYYYKQLQTSCCLTLVTLLREYRSLQVGFFGLVYKVQLPLCLTSVNNKDMHDLSVLVVLDKLFLVRLFGLCSVVST